MKKIFFCFFLSLTFSINAQVDKRLKNIETPLNQILAETKTAGFAVAVIEGDKIIYAKGFGYRNYETKEPVDANTLFAIGSTTKAFTSAILGQLREEDKVDFNASPQKYLPDFRFYEDEMNNQITLRDLMSHRTGLPRHDFSWYFFPTHDKDSLLHRVAFQKPFAGPREQWHYNNFMYLAQGQIAAKITEKSWEDNIKERFFTPLEMKRSAVELNEFLGRDNRSLGYTLNSNKAIEKMDYYDIAGMSPAGSIYSSVHEMANWLKVWINKGKFKDSLILPQAYISEAISSHMVISPGLPTKKTSDIHFSTYGYGWMMTSYKGHYRVEHGGNIDGFSASAAFYPSDSLGIVVLANQNGSSVPSLVRNTLSDRLLKVKKTDWIADYRESIEKSKKAEAEAKANRSSSNHPNTRPSRSLQAFTGSYANDGYGTFKIDLQNDSLIAHFPIKKLFLRHVHYDIFQPFEIKKSGIDTTDQGPIRFNFQASPSGDITELKVNLEAMIEPLSFKRTPISIAVDQETVKQYVGEYILSGTTLKVYLKDDLLYFFVPGQPEYELIATAAHQFVFKMSSEYKIHFVLNEQGSVTGLKVIQPNGTFEAARK